MKRDLVLFMFSEGLGTEGCSVAEYPVYPKEGFTFHPSLDLWVGESAFICSVKDKEKLIDKISSYYKELYQEEFYRYPSNYLTRRILRYQVDSIPYLEKAFSQALKEPGSQIPLNMLKIAQRHFNNAVRPTVSKT